MDKMLVSLGLKYLAAKLDGRKTWIGAAVLILLGLEKVGTGLVALAGIMYPDIAASAGLPPMEADSAMESISAGSALIGAGLAAVGIGHKVEKSGAVSAP